MSTRPALAQLLNFTGTLEIADIGAAWLGDPPLYRRLLDLKLARLNAFDADDRQHAALREAYGADLRLFSDIVGDGARHTLHLAAPQSGMTSLLKPSARHLAFFNGFDRFGEIHETVEVATTRLDDVAGLPDLDFLKMDIQGGELMALEHGKARLAQCAAVQLEVSFVPLYEGQPTFGEIDAWMRGQGFMLHCFAELKPWSIAPVRRNNDLRQPFNQLLEADAVYVRDPLTPERWDPELIRRLVLIAHYAYGSFDLAGRLVQWLEAQRKVGMGSFDHYLYLMTQDEGG
jgi:FkbM family methyltransferase